MGAEHGANQGRETWLERREREARELGYETQPYVLVVGGGQGGIGLGARLRQLDIPTIIIDRHARPGDAWRSRYKSLCLHDPVWYDHLPYIKFPDNWPVFSPKDKIGDWLESYTRVMELNYWTSTSATSARWDEDAQEWVVEGRARRRAGERCARSSSSSPPGCRARRTCRRSPARTSSAASSSTRPSTPGRTGSRTSAWW